MPFTKLSNLMLSMIYGMKTVDYVTQEHNGHIMKGLTPKHNPTTKTSTSVNLCKQLVCTLTKAVHLFLKVCRDRPFI